MHGKTQTRRRSPRVGSLFAGIGGFDLGFERAGFKTAWQVEINPVCRAVLADRFPHAKRYEDVREVGAHNLGPIDVVVGGFPCQDLSTMGARRGLAGERSGLFFEVARVLRELRPRWVVLENVIGLLSSGNGKDFETVLRTLADCGYLGLWRVLDASGFGVPTARRRVYMVGGLGEHPPIELLADAGPAPTLRGAGGAQPWGEAAGWACRTLCAQVEAIAISACDLVAVEGGRAAAALRAREARDNGLRLGLDEANAAEARAAGNAVVPQVAEWIARHLMATF